MGRMNYLAALTLAMGFACTAWAQGPGPVSSTSQLRIDSAVVQGKSGRPQVQGYVYNLYGRPAVTVQLLVEGLDGSGRTVSTKVFNVIGGVPGGGRGWFETAAPTPGETFKVSVMSWAWSR
ncbi:MAG TPA: hypothetical protein VKG64_13445 [Methylomirabilota bacterium]|nr:hypothetical protein [Methylomirabilota bacterium]